MTITPARLKSVLERLESGKGDSKDADLVLSASHHPGIDQTSALRALCSTSYSRRDVDLWSRAVVAFQGDKGIVKLERARILQAVAVFGFLAVQIQ